MEGFAAASGDRSPLHADLEFGRRTAFGERIVYGGLETIALLGLLGRDVQATLRTVRSAFPGPVLIDRVYEARVRLRPGRDDEWELVLRGRGKVLARVLASARADIPRGFAIADAAGEPAPRWGAAFALEAGAELVGSYAPAPGLAALAARLGADAVPAAILAGIAWASHTVGARIPGFDGLCAAVSVTAATGRAAARIDTGPAHGERLRIADVDARSDRIVIDGHLRDADGRPLCLTRVECFPFTPTPLQPAIPPGPTQAEHDGEQVLVVGGSRGAGGAVALALLARGYRVHVVHAASERAARELEALAREHGRSLIVHRADAGDAAAMGRLAATLEGDLTGIVLSAAPAPLPMALGPGTAGELGEYVRTSLNLAATPLSALAPRLRPRDGWLLVLSAAAVVEPCRDLPHFTAAKAALEGLARAVAAERPGITVVIARLPRLRTDLVNTPSARRRAVPAEVVAAELAAELDGPLEPGVRVLAPAATIVDAA
jgi:NAD(P)-dependent dehydrogenase (short-subunit alcohol dehydrogenase family)